MWEKTESLLFKSQVQFMLYKCLFKGTYSTWKLVPMAMSN